MLPRPVAAHGVGAHPARGRAIGHAGMLGVESIAGGGGGLEMVLGVGVLLTFIGLLLRAVTGRIRRSRAASAVVAWLDDAVAPAGEPSGSSGRQPVDLVAWRARELAVLA